ncbi:unnamed protein product [Rotaria socialis]|uniref:Uncharacterized protein n=1 Tax=Rotaria socialis TaxID=392032 RepID=A0A818ZZN0_9BILA|nr:unnamed protein product [Rotaria socialis]CAF4516893.1 unnamed protein product [Rotaria socialis]
MSTECKHCSSCTSALQQSAKRLNSQQRLEDRNTAREQREQDLNISTTQREQDKLIARLQREEVEIRRCSIFEYICNMSRKQREHEVGLEEKRHQETFAQQKHELELDEKRHKDTLV